MALTFKSPRGEIVWTAYYDAGRRLRFFLTSKPLRDYYFLYSVEEDGSFKKLGKSKSPTDLEQKHKVDKIIGVIV